jgi:hypothetical protein
MAAPKDARGGVHVSSRLQLSSTYFPCSDRGGHMYRRRGSAPGPPPALMADVRVVVRQHFPVVVAGPAGRTTRIAETVSEDIALRRRTSRKLRQPGYVERALAEDVLPLVRHDFDREAVAAAAMEISAYVSAACADLRLAHDGVHVLALVDTFACPVVFRRAAAPPPCKPPMMMMPSGAPAPPPTPWKLLSTMMMPSGAPATPPPPCRSRKTMTTPSEVDAFLKSLYVTKTDDADRCRDLADKLPTDDELMKSMCEDAHPCKDAPVVLPSNAELRKYLYVRRTADPCMDLARRPSVVGVFGDGRRPKPMPMEMF